MYYVKCMMGQIKTFILLLLRNDSRTIGHEVTLVKGQCRLDIN